VPIITASAPQATARAMSPPGVHAAVGDDVAVHAGLVQVAHAGAAGVGQGGGQRHTDAQHLPGDLGRPRAGADQDARRTGPHQVQRGLVRRAPAHQHRQLVVADEVLEVERLDRAGHVLGRTRWRPG
jgi:hypothetical protein